MQNNMQYKFRNLPAELFEFQKNFRKVPINFPWKPIVFYVFSSVILRMISEHEGVEEIYGIVVVTRQQFNFVNRCSVIYKFLRYLQRYIFSRYIAEKFICFLNEMICL